ncbi:MAG: adenylate/guanylate cyclase domain-containing protein [Treponema sp.]|jgi:class 3 adenylate cyclase/CHASE2 domain-containing sensor protein|nr:adenylate/guanylate cyclase domain-containing protein [Treponema sp.]
MRKIHKKAIKKIAALVISVLVFAAISLLHLCGAFHFLEYKSYDLRVRFTAPSLRPSDDIIVILLDQDSIDWAQRERGWGWPWPRKAYGELVEYMGLSGANSVAFDILYSEPSVYRNSRQDEIIDNVVANLEAAQAAAAQAASAQTAGTRAVMAEGQPRAPLFREAVRSLYELSTREDDGAFARATQEYGRAVQAVFFSSQSGSARSWPPDLGAPLFEPEGFGGFLERFSAGGGDGALTGAQFPIQGLLDSAGALGCATGTSDSDGTYRRLRLFSLFDGKAVPGFAAASLLVSGNDTGISYNAKSGAIQWGDYSIPVDKNGASLLRFRGSDFNRYIPYSMKDVLLSYEAHQRGEKPALPPEDFSGAYVFVGLYAPGLFDIFTTPMSSVYPGMGMHITMLDNILQGDFTRESPQWLNLLVLLVVVSLTVFFCFFNRVLLSVGGTIFAILGTTAGTFAAYHWGCLWLPMVTYLAGIAAAFISITLYNYATEGSDKRFIKQAFSQYLSPKVIDQIIADPSQLKLGGEKRELTAIFTDIRSFSTITEALGDPEKLVELLNHYLTRMSDIILENQGTIDKYEGDAIIAFFGAPVRLDNHASLACRSAVQMKKAEADINREALAAGLITGAVLEAMVKKGILHSRDDACPMFTRLGINTGDMVVGNMGTPNKMDYTIMGNAVNLAARLEGVNKQYDTGGILVSEYTRDKIGDEFVLRPLSRVRVVGINAPLRLYELLDIREGAPPALLEMVKSWEQGFALYERKDFLAAGNIFQAICQQNTADLAAKKYYNRCSKYLASPPDGKSWDGGVDNLTEK